MRVSLTRPGEKPDLVVALIAHEWEVEIGEVPSLASVSVRCLDTNLKNLRDVVTHALYLLDSRLAWGEMAESTETA
jgi:hypothetical protein